MLIKAHLIIFGSTNIGLFCWICFRIFRSSICWLNYTYPEMPLNGFCCQRTILSDLSPFSGSKVNKKTISWSTMYYYKERAHKIPLAKRMEVVIRVVNKLFGSKTLETILILTWFYTLIESISYVYSYYSQDNCVAMLWPIHSSYFFQAVDNLFNNYCFGRSW